ncbi:hypothetical protein STEG23_006860 [Scotinomys teguina]
MHTEGHDMTEEMTVPSPHEEREGPLRSSSFSVTTADDGYVLCVCHHSRRLLLDAVVSVTIADDFYDAVVSVTIADDFYDAVVSVTIADDFYDAVVSVTTADDFYDAVVSDTTADFYDAALLAVSSPLQALCMNKEFL